MNGDHSGRDPSRAVNRDRCDVSRRSLEQSSRMRPRDSACCRSRAPQGVGKAARRVGRSVRLGCFQPVRSTRPALRHCDDPCRTDGRLQGRDALSKSRGGLRCRADHLPAHVPAKHALGLDPRVDAGSPISGLPYCVSAQPTVIVVRESGRSSPPQRLDRALLSSDLGVRE